MVSSSRDHLRELLERALEAGRSLPHFTRSEIESSVRELLAAAPPAREQLEDAIEEIRARSRRGLDSLTDLIRAEVRREVKNEVRRRREDFSAQVGEGLEVLGSLFDRLIGSSNPQGATVSESRSDAETAPEMAGARSDDADVGTRQAKMASRTKKASAKKAPAERSVAKKAASTSNAAKKTSAKKVAAKKVAAKKKLPGKKVPGTRLPAKRPPESS